MTAFNCLTASCMAARHSHAPAAQPVRRASIFSVHADDEDNPLMSPKLVRRRGARKEGREGREGWGD